MPKKKRASWFTILKRLFVSEPRSRLGLGLDKDKQKRWAFRLVRMKELTVAEPTSPVEAAGPQQLHTSSHDVSKATAAIKIQAMFRGYLARKALRALKGVVKLQALIRGWAVRQQAINTLKCLQSIVNIQSKTTAKDRLLQCQEYKQHDLWEKDIRVDLNSQKSREESHPSKREGGLIKRERMKEYYLNHRRSAETERDRAFGRRRYWLEQWVDAQLAKSEAQRTLSANGNSSSSRHPSSRQFYNQAAETPDSPMHVPRIRSYQHRKQRSIGDESSFTMPAYMAATESAKARARSLSSPRLRPLSFDVCSEITSPYKHKLKLSPISSINSELTSSSWIGNISHVHVQKSPRLKNLAGPVKSTTSIRGNRANEASPKRKT